MKKTRIVKACATFAIAGAMAFGMVGCGGGGNDKASDEASSEAATAESSEASSEAGEEATNEADSADESAATPAESSTAADSGEAIIADSSEKVYDARTTSDTLPEDFRTEMPDGWSIWAEITDRNGEECISIDFGNPSGTTYTKPFEEVGFPSDPKLLTLWGANAKSWTESPTFIISIGTSKDAAKTWVMSYVEDKSNMLFWTPDGAELAMPGKAYSIDGMATAFDGTELTVGGKSYELGSDMTIIEK